MATQGTASTLQLPPPLLQFQTLNSIRAPASMSEQHVATDGRLEAPPLPEGPPPVIPPPPPQVGGDEEMDLEDATGAQGDTLTKRKRGSRTSGQDDDYNVSDDDPASSDSRKLRKLSPQSVWDKEWQDAMPVRPPPDLLDWNREHGLTTPYRRFYDETRWLAAPNARAGNPHYLVAPSPEGARPEQPLRGYLPFTPGPFPFTHISAWRHYGNIVEPQRDLITSQAATMLALVPLGGGRAMNKIAGALAQMYESWLKSLCFEGYDGQGAEVSVIPPDAKHPGSEASVNPFAQPWSYIVAIGNDPGSLVRDFLIDQQVFAISPECCFTIHSLTPKMTESWKTLVLTGAGSFLNTRSTVHNDIVNRKRELLNLIKDRLRAAPTFRSLIAKLAATYINHTGDREQVFQTVTSTYYFDVANTECEGGFSPALVLMTRPIAETRREREELRRLITEALCGPRCDHFYYHTRKITVYDDSKAPKPTVDCKLCKADTHRTADCPLPLTKGWKGLTAGDLGKEDKPEKALSVLEVDTRAAVNDVLGAIRGETPGGSGSGKGKALQGARGGWKSRGGSRGSHGASRGGSRGGRTPR